MGTLALSFLVTAGLVFSTFFLLFRKYSVKKKPTRNINFWLSAFVATPVFYIGFLSIWLLISSVYEKKEFDKQGWQDNRETRYEYVEDLTESNVLFGLTRLELINMLGEADYEDDTLLTYYIGYSPEHFFNMDPDWLETNFTNGKVSSVVIRE